MLNSPDFARKRDPRLVVAPAPGLDSARHDLEGARDEGAAEKSRQGQRKDERRPDQHEAAPRRLVDGGEGIPRRQADIDVDLLRGNGERYVAHDAPDPVDADHLRGSGGCGLGLGHIFLGQQLSDHPLRLRMLDEHDAPPVGDRHRPVLGSGALLQLLTEPAQVQGGRQDADHVASVVPDGHGEGKDGMRREAALLEDRRVLSDDEALHVEGVVEIGAVGEVVLGVDGAGRSAADMPADVHRHEGQDIGHLLLDRLQIGAAARRVEGADGRDLVDGEQQAVDAVEDPLEFRAHQLGLPDGKVVHLGFTGAAQRDFRIGPDDDRRENRDQSKKKQTPRQCHANAQLNIGRGTQSSVTVHPCNKSARSCICD